jgi:hypothetical protein
VYLESLRKKGRKTAGGISCWDSHGLVAFSIVLAMGDAVFVDGVGRCGEGGVNFGIHFGAEERFYEWRSPEPILVGVGSFISLQHISTVDSQLSVSIS